MRPALFAAFLTACTAETEGPGTGTDTATTTVPGDMVTAEQTVSGTSDSDGELTFTVTVAAGDTAFQAYSVCDDFIVLAKIVDPSGTTVFDAADWLSKSTNVTGAILPVADLTTVSWPIRDVDPPLIPGDYQVTVRTQSLKGAVVADAAVDTTWLVKADPDFSAGAYSARIVWAENVDDDPAIVDAVEQAVDLWIQIWGDAGLTLTVEYDKSKISSTLNFAGTATGSPSVADEAKQGTGRQLQLVVGETIQGQDALFGMADAIPGPIGVTNHSYVVLSWLTHAGTDGLFDEAEIRVMGETMAHESGHFTGLFHPVEISMDQWDAIDDTEKCTGFNDCEDSLGKNLMYPYPICRGFSLDTCNPQEKLTTQQTAVSQRYVGAL